MVDHTLDDAVDGVQEVGVLAHGQQGADLGVQQVVPETHTIQYSTGMKNLQR